MCSWAAGNASKSSEFKPSKELLADLADEAAYRREQDARERAHEMGMHA